MTVNVYTSAQAWITQNLGAKGCTVFRTRKIIFRSLKRSSFSVNAERCCLFFHFWTFFYNDKSTHRNRINFDDDATISVLLNVVRFTASTEINCNASTNRLQPAITIQSQIQSSRWK